MYMTLYDITGQLHNTRVMERLKINALILFSLHELYECALCFNVRMSHVILYDVD